MALSKQTFYLNNEPVEVKFILETIDDDKVQFWFAAKEFASCMGYERPDMVIERINQKYSKKFEQLCHQSTTGIHPHTVFVNEPGLYQMILSSKLKNNRVEPFKKWVFEEVLPTIRKTGQYKIDTAVVPTANNDANTVALLQTISQNIVCLKEDNDYLRNAIVRKDEQLHENQKMMQKICAEKDEMIQKIVVHKDQQINRVMNDMNRMYTGFQETMQKKDEQVTSLVEKVIDLSDRAVEYPVSEKKQPILCIAKDQTGTTFTAIAGQRPYVEQQKNKRGINETNIVHESKRPNPQVDWNNATHQVSEQKVPVKKSKRSLSFDSAEDAAQFEQRIKHMLNSKLIVKK
ncbi:bro-d [Mamestra brassicae multiple nucleopolyhedrovirus]|uniref:Bro-d n=1 Tax=Mamestra brassicae nuclear polyhedrosis virus TaxID=78219 RepID=I3XMD0_NPVMB|nr:bro-d [Mamestra brassicae multiple nucleopolyhedrovirus]AFL64963.1 bro-d [Mamestra brassicae multiple nucleopolyhedrovirus]WRQ96686.1 bro-e [Mamestra configurata nucleopolyhedrovirus B]WRQ96847.1 bro-e [Mamestra configurata nucleopolyhedrovirus B]WRQ97008.1 bro-e [Mamestra configurata nucleopolyhedrovirus B]